MGRARVGFNGAGLLLALCCLGGPDPAVAGPADAKGGADRKDGAPAAIEAGERTERRSREHETDAGKIPWLGIVMRGNRIVLMGSDAPARRSGLEEGDRVLTVSGGALDEKDGNNSLRALLADRKPGDEVSVTFMRGDEELTRTVALGSRLDAIAPMVRGGRTAWRQNAAILPGFQENESELEARVRELCKDPALNEAWSAVLTDRRAQRIAAGKPEDPRLVDSTLPAEWEALLRSFVIDEARMPGFYKLERETYVRRDPLAFESVTRALLDPLEAAAFQEQPRLDLVIAEMAEGLDVSTDGATFAASDAPADTGSAVGKLKKEDGSEAALPDGVFTLARGVRDANALLDRAFSKLTDEETEFLSAQLPVLADRFARFIYLHVDAPEEELERNLRALDLTKKIDYGALAGATIAAVVGAVDQPGPDNGTGAAEGAGAPSALEGLAEALTGAAPSVHELDGVVVSINGGGDPATADVVIDARGDTAWDPAVVAAPPFGRTRILVDLAGNDTYTAGAFGGVAAAVGGVSVLIDLEGDDRYLGGSLTQGAALAGAGVLWDVAGDDLYTGDAYVGGAAMFGFGLLLDSVGNDTRKANLYAWGMGGPKGAGACLDAKGDDHSIGGGRYPTSYGQPAGEYQGMSFGFAIGFRLIAAGGLGIYVDGAGKDLVSAGEFSIGGAYFLGYGAYHDLAGDDVVHSSRYGVGFGVHAAVGIALDDGGDDLYDGQTAASLGSSWDLGVGMLIDANGDDIYVCDGLGLGGAAQNGLAVLWDKAGNDIYRGRGGTQGEGRQFEYAGGRGAKNFGLLLDDGGTDSYSCGLTDGEAKVRGTVGLAVDR